MKSTSVQPTTYLDRPRFELRPAQEKAAASGLWWKIPIKSAAMQFRDHTEARRARREMPGAIGESCAAMLEASAPRRKLTPTALKVGAEIARRERMQVCAEWQVIAGVDRAYVRAAVNMLAAWTQSAKSAVEIGLDRLEDAGELIRIRKWLPHPSGDGRLVHDATRYRIAWWARERWGLPAIDGLGQALLVLRELRPAPASDPRTDDPGCRPAALELTDQGIAEAVDRHIAVKWRDLGPFYQRQGISFQTFRTAEIERLESEPAKYLRAVLSACIPRRPGGAAASDPGRPPPG